VAPNALPAQAWTPPLWPFKTLVINGFDGSGNPICEEVGSDRISRQNFARIGTTPHQSPSCYRLRHLGL
jgi:hypothetical protein